MLAELGIEPDSKTNTEKQEKQDVQGLMPNMLGSFFQTISICKQWRDAFWQIGETQLVILNYMEGCIKFEGQKQVFTSQKVLNALLYEQCGITCSLLERTSPSPFHTDFHVHCKQSGSTVP